MGIIIIIITSSQEVLFLSVCPLAVDMITTGFDHPEKKNFRRWVLVQL